MKTRTMILCLLCAVGIQVSAETVDGYQPLVEEGKSWTVQERSYAGGTWTADEKYGYYLSGDTLIDGKRWKKLYTNRLRGKNSVTYMDEAASKKAGLDYYCLGAMMEEGKKVYAVNNLDPWRKPRLVYDFSLEVGDTVMCGYRCLTNSFRFSFIQDSAFEEDIDRWDGNYLTLNRTDTVWVDGLGHRRFVFSHINKRKNFTHDDCVVWIEGVGSNHGPYLPWDILPNDGWFELSSRKDGKLLFSDADFYSGDAHIYHGTGQTVGLTSVTWKLAGFGTDGSDEESAANPYNLSSLSNTVRFFANGTFYGYSQYNEFQGLYTTYRDELTPLLYGGTKVWEITDGGRFIDVLNGKMTRYELRDGQLRLYYNDGQDFLLLVNQAEAAGIDSPTEALAHDGPLYDLQGRRLAAKPQRGVYIQGGRKYVVR